jgi:hypothetical protein
LLIAGRENINQDGLRGVSARKNLFIGFELHLVILGESLRKWVHLLSKSMQFYDWLSQ